MQAENDFERMLDMILNSNTRFSFGIEKENKDFSEEGPKIFLGYEDTQGNENIIIDIHFDKNKKFKGFHIKNMEDEDE